MATRCSALRHCGTWHCMVWRGKGAARRGKGIAQPIFSEQRLSAARQGKGDATPGTARAAQSTAEQWQNKPMQFFILPLQ